jgi:iron complex outermembrane receptor protein
MIAIRRAAKFSAFAFCIICSVAQAAPLSRQVDFNIAAQRLAAAIIQFSEQAHVQVISSGIDVTDQTTPGVVGRYSVADALSALLKGTGLRYKAMNENTVSLQLIKQGPGPAQTGPAVHTSLELAQADPIQNQGAAAQDSAVTGLSEITVTAEKRSERLQDVPVPVTAISAESLLDSNQLRLQDYYSSVPGLTVAPTIQSAQVISIRGITTGASAAGGSPTVGVLVDDAPYGASQNNGNAGLVVPDIDPGDLARVEVLRGPQGTLYGAGSMGGLLKFVTADPSTDALSGRIRVGTSSVYNGAELGYNFRGSVNIPLSDTIAVRASGFTRQDPGYIDNPVLHINGINEEHTSGGRLSALWRPSDALSLKLSALYQQTKGDGSGVVDLPTAGFPQTTGLGDLQQNDLRGTGGYDRTIRAYAATLTAKLGIVDLTAISGYSINTYSDSFDYTYLLGDYTHGQFGVAGSPVLNHSNTNKFTQEVRFSIPIGQNLEWLFGAFYTHERSAFEQNLLAEDPATGATAGSWLYDSFPTTYSEYAAFTDLTVHITDRFDVQFGGRESEIRQNFRQTFIGPYDPFFLGTDSPVISPEVDSKDSAFTYLVTPRFRLSPDFMVYARLASGYRPGGPNTGAGVPRQFNPDTTENYEIGIKNEMLDHTLSLDASLYYIDWKHIQLGLTDPTTGVSYIANASQAKSQGLELSINSRPLTGLAINAWIVWSDAVLTRTFPAASVLAGVYGVSGDRLPDSSRFSGNLSVQQDFRITSRTTGFVEGAMSYVGQRLDAFTGSAQRQNLPAYVKTDLRAGAKYDDWALNLFVNNVANRRGIIDGGLGNIPPYGLYYIQPRTVGLSITRTF